MKVAVRMYKKTTDSSDTVFEIEGCIHLTPASTFDALRTYITAAKAVWPGEFKHVRITGYPKDKK